MIRKGKKQIGSRPSRALHAHGAIYEANPEVQCIVNAQPVNALAFSIVHRKVDTYTIPESYVFVGDVSLLPFESSLRSHLVGQEWPTYFSKTGILACLRADRGHNANC